MSQHDLTIDNQGFPAFRADLNNALQALGSTQSGTTAPSPAFANQLWYDTTNNQLKIRNEDNDAWISVVTLDQSADVTSGVGAKTLPTGDLVGTSDSQTLTNKTINASQLVDGSVTSAKLSTNAQYTGFKNRIINGAMVIDQRNAGASVTPTTDTYTLDRWQIATNVSSLVSVQQSSTAPTGFTNSTLITSLSAYTIGAGELCLFRQAIEGYNIADLGFGTANAKTITISFFVRSSLTGTFGGALTNSSENRSFPFTYTISVANTFEYKTITVAGDTSGTWLTTNGAGLKLVFGLGVGSTFSGPANAWAGSAFFSATGATSLVGTNGATFYITGVQLEVGSTATSFDYRPFGTELALCQRYCINYRSADGGVYMRYGSGYANSATNLEINMHFPVQMPTNPSLTVTSTPANYGIYIAGGINTCNSGPALDGNSKSSLVSTINASSASTFSSSGGGSIISNNNATSYVLFTAEL